MPKSTMQWLVVPKRTATSEHAIYGTKAVCCGNAVKSGQAVLSRYVLGQGYFSLHRRCLVTLLLEGPQDQDVEAFEELRNAIVAAGDFFGTRRV